MERGETEDNRGTRNEITIDDVMVAIKVLKLYLKQYNEAVRVLRSLNYMVGSSSYRSDPILELAKQMMVKQKEEQPEDEYIDEESLEKLRRIKDRFIKEQNI